MNPYFRSRHRRPPKPNSVSSPNAARITLDGSGIGSTYSVAIPYFSAKADPTEFRSSSLSARL